MGNFKNVTMGTGILKINDVDSGFLKGAVNYKLSYDLLDFKAGTPLTLRGSVAREVAVQLSAPLAELTAENASALMGGIPPAVTSGELVDKTASFEDRTFSLAPWSRTDGIEAIKLGDNENLPLWVLLSDGADAPVLMDSSMTVTYVEGEDYLVDYKTGYVYRNNSGSISSGQSVKVKYKFTPPASKSLSLGYHYNLPEVKVEFVHTNPHLGKKVTVLFWKAKVSGSASMQFEEDKWLINQVVFKSIYDDAHENSPLGYINFET